MCAGKAGPPLTLELVLQILSSESSFSISSSSAGDNLLAEDTDGGREDGVERPSCWLEWEGPPKELVLDCRLEEKTRAAVLPGKKNYIPVHNKVHVQLNLLEDT